MNRCYVIVEGPIDELVFRHLLHPLESERILEFRVAGGRSAADSLARSLLASGRGDVAVVVDADTLDPNQIEERKQFLARSLQAIAAPGKWHVTVMVPELEGLFFRDKHLLEELIGGSVSEKDFLSGQYEPSRTLIHLLGGDHRKSVLERKLPVMDLQRIRDTSPIRELNDFLQRTAHQAAA